MVELKVKLGPKGQVLIPKILREAHQIYPNQEVIMTEQDDGILIKRKEIKDPLKVFESIAESIYRKGKSPKYAEKEFYEQYEKRSKRAGL